MLNDGETVQEDLEQLDSSSPIVVPKAWLAATLAKCSGKGKSFTLKKLMDGFFVPEFLVGKKASQLINSSKEMKALECMYIYICIYAYN